uniref:dynein heavy chain 9, axonemal n=1 Tax=Ciona intestinalis TaxID=7719 RepID=UPI00089DAC1C|nr:dynein heavy chain 9, axonemal [Ciona intestinalis]|eukprot:XP_018669150.1 dynein heavy chain 9, axonemal [Ciona intestinalis]
MRYVVSPSCDRVLLSMCQALQTNTGVAISNSSTMSGAPESLCELSYQLGRALYNVVCTQSVDHYMLGDLFKGLAETGCWMCLSRFDSLSAPVLSVAGQLAAEVQKALRGGKPSITLMSEEVTLSPTAACFITLDGAKEPQKLKTGFKSMLNVAVPTMLALPEECSTYFRTVNAVQPDRRLVLEIQLLSQGFTQADQLSRKLCVFLDLCSSLLSTLPTQQEHDPAMRENSSAAECSKHGIGCHDNSYTSISLMEHVITGAGVVLDVLFREQIEMKHEYREVIASKTRKFAGIWKHRSSLMSSSGGLVPSSNAADDNGHDGLLGIGVSASSLAPSVDPTTQEAIQANKDREVVESDAEAMRKMEEVAVVTALRNILAPRLPMKEDRSLVSTFVMDLWPDADVDFGLEEEEEERTEVPRGEFTSPPEDWDEEMNADVTIPDNLADSETRPFDPKLPEHEPVNDVEAAVAIATKECGLSPAVKFQAKAAQLTELSESIKSVIVCGGAGCGKSKCVEVYTQTQKQLGFHVICKKVYINAIDSQRKLFGYFESPTREWKDGLMQTLLRPHCLGQDTPTSTENSLKPNVFILHVDGKMRAEDTDLFLQILRTQPGSGSWLSLPNNERLRLPPDLRVIWEMENLASLDPSVISKLGVLGFNSTEVTWKLHLSHWLQNLPDSIVSITKDIVMRYLPTLVNHFSKFTAPAHLVDNGAIQLQQTIRISNQAMTATFCKLMDCFLPHSEDVSPVERERFVGYCAFWAFGGTLEGAGRDSFASWWSETWPNLFPINGSDVWRQFVDAETRLFARWEDHLPQFSGSSLVSGAFVPTPDTCQLTHIVGALLDAGHAAMIVGPPGCGKSALVRERIHTVSSGEVAEVLSLFLHCNRLTEAGTLWKQVSQHLEWKHGVTYTPRGNKKLLCMVDDVNLSRPLGTENENMYLQSACELIRQHLDVGGVRNPNTNKWQQVSSTSYVTTCNPNHTGTSCAMSQRMTRHFSVFSCPYPSATSQHAIYSTLVQSHFLVEPSLSNRTNNIERDRAFQNLLSSITLVTVELQERLRGMYLSTPERAHYTFALNDLERIFRNLMLSLGPDCHQRELLLLWRHECDWSYGKRMVSDVDCERYLQALDTAVRKHLTENKYLPLVLASKQPLFSSVRELDSGLVTAGRHFGRNSSRASGSGNSGGHVTDYYKPAQSEKEVQQLLMEAVKEYNKINVQMKLSLYSDTIALVCRLARVIQSPHPISHTLLFGDGCPVLAQLTVKLAAHLGGFRVVTLPPIIAPSTTDSHSHNMGGPSSSSDLERTRLAHMKKHLVQLYNQAGVKGEKLVFLLHDDKEVTHECLTMVEELVRHGSISHLFTNDEQTTIANSVRSEVTAAGLTYSRDVAWNFFLNTVTKNLRVVFICSQTGAPFMEKSLEFPALFSRMSCVALDHWCHDQLVANAMYHVTNGHQDTVGISNDLIGGEADHVMDDRWRENVVHLLANMHVAVREKDNNKFYKIQGHVCNYAFEKLVERFVCVYRDRRKMVQESHESIKGALENIDRENLVAEALQKDLDREKQVLDEHKSGTLKLLAQIGQDMVITEQQVSAVRKQIRKIRHLKKSLPEYELAHEKAVFKAAAIVADTKTVVKEINIQDLSELRSLQKPDSDVEDLMAAIIMILKSPNSDVTWSKGAKRQMANLDRFLDELANFDEVPMPQGTLENLESFWEKETFTPENLTAKAGGNTAAGSLLKWVQGVVRYHTTMINRVKPLHAKVQETASSIGDAQHKLRQLESKKGALEARLHDLAEGFEQATADKNTQEEKRMEMQDHSVAAEFRQVLTEEHKRCCAALNSHKVG